MTRFARAKGSKASNERLPEEATPWSEIKKQLLEKKKEAEDNIKRKDLFEKRAQNYKAFLEEKEKDESKNTSWAQFSITVKEKSKKKKTSVSNENAKSTELENSSSNCDTKESDGDDDPPEEKSSKTEVVEPTIVKKKKKPKKLSKILLESPNNDEENNVNNEESKPTRKREASESGEGKNKKAKKISSNKNIPCENDKQKSNDKKQKNKIVKENLTENDIKKIEKKKQKRIKQLEKKKRIKDELKKQKEEQAKNQENISEEKNDIPKPIKSFDKTLNQTTYPKIPLNKSTKFSDKNKKPRNNEEHSRRKPMLPNKMFVNGKEIEIDYVDGFPVKKEDALRLKKLRGEMISKGLPRSEINAALKLERRKAEKAFAREKKKVCYHCRKSGHNLSECPNFDKNEVATTAAEGICFKCGSTEHTHFECKVVRGQEYRYATCFICNQQGHIARQCPDNARGLYPKGGACKVCGDVTHLKKDCMKYQAQQKKQEENFKLETLGNSNPDVLEDQTEYSGAPVVNKRPNKIIKF